MIPQFIRFYGCTYAEVLNEYSRTFFALVNSMFELKASETLNDIAVKNADETTVSILQKQERGLGAIVGEVKTIQEVKNVN